MSIQSVVRGMKGKSNIIDFAYEQMHEIKVQKRKKMDDETFARTYYLEKTGKILNLKNPTTFDEKQWWLKLYYRNPLQTLCADKYRVREYVTECVGDEILNELYAVYDNASDIDISALPDNFFLKTNHGCGANYWCHNKDDFQVDKVKKQLNKSLKSNYFDESREWPYKNIQPKIIAEEVMEPHVPSELIDFRFLCFSGKCEYLFIDVDTCAADGHHRPDARRNVYDRDGNYIDVRVTRNQFPVSRVTIPGNYMEMRNIAEKLSEPFPFVRVDLYSFDDMIRFGEMTFFHAGGVSIMQPDSFQKELGSKIILPIDG